MALDEKHAQAVTSGGEQTSQHDLVPSVLAFGGNVKADTMIYNTSVNSDKCASNMMNIMKCLATGAGKNYAVSFEGEEPVYPDEIFFDLNNPAQVRSLVEHLIDNPHTEENPIPLFIKTSAPRFFNREGVSDEAEIIFRPCDIEGYKGGSLIPVLETQAAMNFQQFKQDGERILWVRSLSVSKDSDGAYMLHIPKMGSVTSIVTRQHFMPSVTPRVS